MTGGVLRIGTAERTSAMKALDEHLEAGRLGVQEYADRSAHAANATTAGELQALFADLPTPHPVLPGGPMGATASAPTTHVATPPHLATSQSNAPARRGALDSWGPRITAVVPIAAVVLFFVTGSWLWFLLIPAVGALVYGGGVGRVHDSAPRRSG